MSDQLPIDPMDIQMTMTKLAGCERRLVIEVPARLVKRFHKKLKKSGEDASPEASGMELKNFCIDQSFKRFDLNPIWGPIETPNSDTLASTFRLGQDFKISIDVDSRPDIEWPEFSTLEIVRPIRDITDDMIDNEMDEQCRDAGKRIPLKDEIQQGDEIRCRVTLSEQGSDSPLYTQEDATVRIPEKSGSTNIFGMPVDGIGENIVGSTVGQIIKVKTTVPDEYDDPTLRGTTVDVELEILEAFRVELATIEEVIEQYGSPSETILRQQIRLALEGKATRDQNAAINFQIYKHLVNHLEVPLPKWITRTYHDSIAEATKVAMEQRGCSENAIKQRLAEKESNIKIIGEEMAKKRAIANMLGQHLGLQVDENSIIKQIAEMAAIQGRRPEEIRKEIMAENKLQSIAIAVIEQKTVDRLIEEVTLTDMPADEWVASQQATA